jgi:hypothetical protein
MTDTIDEEVKEFTEKVDIEPTKDEELVEVDEEEESPDSSSEENKEPELEEETPEVPEVDETPVIVLPKPVEGESPRERALRLELTRVKGVIRDQKRDELFVKKTVAPEEDLSEYDPEELKRFETLATKMGFAKKNEIVQDKNNSEFETFIDAHPEYSSENDKDGTLWNRFKTEFNLYVAPKDPKTLKMLLNRVHNEIYGVQPAKNLNKINASQEKIKVASHTGASAGKETRTKTQETSGLRIDALKGFSEEEKKELFG